ncbi:MAG: RNA polymerase sigma factor [Pirellula sp.]
MLLYYQLSGEFGDGLRPTRTYYILCFAIPMQSPDSRPGHGVPVTDLVQAFDADSIRELMSYYHPLLRQIAQEHWCSKLRRRYGISDAIQNTWVSLTSHSPKRRFDNRGQFTAYLACSLGNQIKSLRRRVSAKKRGTDQETDLGEIPIIDVIADQQDHNQLDVLIQKEMVCATLAALLRQPREIQRLLRWRFRKKMTYAQIGAKIERNADDVRYLINTCLREIAREVRSEQAYSY